MEYTIEVYKKDGRVKKAKYPAEVGERRVDTIDINVATIEEAQAIADEKYPAPKYRTIIHVTMVERLNLMSREKYWEMIEWMPGTPAGVDASLDQIRSGAEAIARFHACAAGLGVLLQVAPAVISRLRRLDELASPMHRAIG